MGRSLSSSRIRDACSLAMAAGGKPTVKRLHICAMSHNQTQRHLATMDFTESVTCGLVSTPSFDISLDMGDSTSQVPRAGSQASIPSLRPTSSLSADDDMAIVLLELGLTAEERKQLEVRTNQERSSISRVKTEEWMDTDEFLWSPSGC